MKIRTRPIDGIIVNTTKETITDSLRKALGLRFSLTEIYFILKRFEEAYPKYSLQTSLTFSLNDVETSHSQRDEIRSKMIMTLMQTEMEKAIKSRDWYKSRYNNSIKGEKK